MGFRRTRWGRPHWRRPAISTSAGYKKTRADTDPSTLANAGIRRTEPRSSRAARDGRRRGVEPRRGAALLEAAAQTERCMRGRRRVQTLGLGLVLRRIKAAGPHQLLSLALAARISRRAAARSSLPRPAGTHWLMNLTRFSRRGRTRSSLVRICAAAPRHAGGLGSRRDGTWVGGFRARRHLLTTLVARRRAGACLGMGGGESKRSGG